MITGSFRFAALIAGMVMSFTGCSIFGGAASRRIEYYYESGKKISYRSHPALLRVSVRDVPKGAEGRAYVDTIAASFGLRVVTLNQVDDLSSSPDVGPGDRRLMEQNIWLLAKTSGGPFARSGCPELARLRTDGRITYAGSIIQLAAGDVVSYDNTGYAVLDSPLPAREIDSLLFTVGCRAFNWDGPRSFFFMADVGMGEAFWEVEDRLMATGKFRTIGTEKIGI
jgi:hypothetical protein